MEVQFFSEPFMQRLLYVDFKETEILKEIRSSRKYGASAQKEEPTTSTSDGN
jgi:hypothetical protein